MVHMVDVSDGLEDKIMKKAVFLLIEVLVFDKIGEGKSSFMLVWRGIILKSIENNDIVCLFVELFDEMVLMVDVSDGLEDKIMKNDVFIDYSTSSWWNWWRKIFIYVGLTWFNPQMKRKCWYCLFICRVIRWNGTDGWRKWWSSKQNNEKRRFYWLKYLLLIKLEKKNLHLCWFDVVLSSNH